MSAGAALISTILQRHAVNAPGGESGCPAASVLARGAVIVLILALAGCNRSEGEYVSWRVSFSAGGWGTTWTGVISDGEIVEGRWWQPDALYVRNSGPLEGVDAVVLMTDSIVSYHDGECWYAELGVFSRDGESYSRAHRLVMQEYLGQEECSGVVWGTMHTGLGGTIIFSVRFELLQWKWENGNLSLLGELSTRSGGRAGRLLMSPDKSWGLLRDEGRKRWDVIEWNGSHYEPAGADSTRRDRRSWPVIELDSESNTIKILERSGAGLAERERVDVTRGRLSSNHAFFSQTRTFALVRLLVPHPIEGVDEELSYLFSLDLESLKLRRIDTSDHPEIHRLSMFAGYPYPTSFGYRFIQISPSEIREDNLAVPYYYIDVDSRGVPLGEPVEALLPGHFPLDPVLTSLHPSWSSGRAPMREE